MDCLLCRKLAMLHELPDEEIVWQFPHSVAFLGPHQYYHGYCVLVARTHAAELSQLSSGQRHAFFDEMCLLAAAIEGAFRPRKLNYELLGNQVPHLHWHLFPRSGDDPEYLKPVWLALDRAERDDGEKERLCKGHTDRKETTAQLREAIRKLAICSSQPGARATDETSVARAPG